MSLDLQRAYVEKRIADFLAANFVAVPCAFENVPFTQPDSTFAALNIMEGESFRANLGKTYVTRHPGLIQIDVYQPVNTGTKEASDIAEAIGEHFKEHSVRLDDGAVLVFRVPSYPRGPKAKGFFRVMCRVGYYRDEMTVS